MKDYGHLLADDPEWAERAEAFAAKVRDVHELLAEHEPQRRAPPGRRCDVAYHDACHLAHAQGVRAQPRELLRGDPRPRAASSPPSGSCAAARPASTTWCSPSRRPSSASARRDNLLATGAEAIAAANPGCALQIARPRAGCPSITR